MNKFRSYRTPAQAIEKSATALVENATLLEKGFTLPVNPNDGLAIFPVSPDVLKPFKKKLPLQDLIPRVPVTGGIGFGYKVIDAWDTSGVSGKVQDGRRGRFLTTALKNVTHLFATIGFENFTTDNAQLASENLSVQSQAINIVIETLAYMIAEEEEKKIIGGNRTALEEIVSISATESDVASSLTAGDYNVIAVPLTLYGLEQSSVSRGVRLTHTENNADGTITTIVGGYGIKKSLDAVVTVEANKSVKVTVEDVPSAAGYAIYFGATGSESLVYVGAINSTTISAVASNGAQLASALANTDQSQDLELDWDGLLAIAGHGNGVVVSLDGEEIEVDGIYVSAFEDALSEIKDRDVEVTHIVMNSKTLKAYYKAVAKNVTLTMSPGNRAPSLTMGGRPEAYESAFSTGEVPFVIDDFVPNGMVFLLSIGSSAPLGVEGNMLAMYVQQERYVEAWARVTRSYQFGIYETSVLACRKPSAIGVIKNIGGIGK